ncbi:MAG TPA: F0F1 ATP synthase subunit alpha [Candidatus Pacearchaeota archaeon]|nr:F0F1 ATP synthase subunit alpha [Candidatus Pacearchaeota archaeon]
MDIIEKFKKQLEGIEIKSDLEETGEVIEIKDVVAKISGLKNVENFELIFFEESNIYGLALNLEEFEVGAVVLGDASKIKEGHIVKRTGSVFSVNVGEELLGRVVDPLGNPIDGKGEIQTKQKLPLERKGPSVMDRQPVKEPMHTGIKIVDALTPIGRGQRQLIIGDKGLGKTAVAIDTIINQKNEKDRPVCIYVACGQKKSKVKRLVKILEEAGALDYSIVVAAFPDDPAPMLYLAPFTGVTMGEYFRDKGGHALLVYDDLTRQAWAWREISLILRRPPGREAYPGDVFYLHSRLLERAAKLSTEKGGGSLTALPIIETQAGDISGYIPTNVISITDGQIFLDSNLYRKDQKPAMDIGASVSRVGSSAQTKAMKKACGSLKLNLTQFQELERFSEFTEELDPETKKILEKGKAIIKILKQKDLEPLSFDKQVVIIYAATNCSIEDLKMKDLETFQDKLFEEIQISKPEIFEEIQKTRELSDETRKNIGDIVKKVKESYGS